VNYSVSCRVVALSSG